MNNNIDVWLLCVFICLFMCIFFNVAIICTVIKYMIFLFYSKFKCAIFKVQVQYLKCSGTCYTIDHGCSSSSNDDQMIEKSFITGHISKSAVQSSTLSF